MKDRVQCYRATDDGGDAKAAERRESLRDKHDLSQTRSVTDVTAAMRDRNKEHQLMRDILPAKLDVITLSFRQLYL